MSNDDDNEQVFKGTTTEDVRLEDLGYEQGEIFDIRRAKSRLAGESILMAL